MAEERDLYEVLVGRLNLRDEPNGVIVVTLPRTTVLEATGPVQVDQTNVKWLPVIVPQSAVAGFVCEQYVGKLDVVGPKRESQESPLEVTEAGLRQLAPTAKGWIVSALATEFAAKAASHGILKTPLRLCHFLAQAAHETSGFQTLEEYGGQLYWSRYEGRTDLGNTEAGDGIRFHGRGIFQLTGRANYRDMSKKIDVGLEDSPDLAADPANSLLIACKYWTARRLEVPADANDIIEITRRVNGGGNGLAERQTYFRRAWSIWGEPGAPPPFR